MTETKTYATGTEAARMIRAKLKATYPGVKFSVRTNSDVHVRWADGPTRLDVAKLLAEFDGRGYVANVLVERSLSPEFRAELEAKVAKRYGLEAYDPNHWTGDGWASHEVERLARDMAR